MRAPTVKVRFGRQMTTSTRRVLDFLRAHPGHSIDQLNDWLPTADMKTRLGVLRRGGYAYCERKAGTRAALWFATGLEPAGPDLLPRYRNERGTRTPPRVVDVRTPWPDPYLSDDHLRPGSQDFREWPSLRLGRRVWCYRRSGGQP
jgi:hypothetical protein